MQLGSLPVRWEDGQVIVTLPDEIDMASHERVRDQLYSLADQQPRALIVDMSSTTFCDSAGVRMLVLAHQRAAEGNCPVRIVVSSPHLLRVLSITGADQVVQVHPRLDSALQSVQDRPPAQSVQDRPPGWPGAAHRGSGSARARGSTMR